MSWEALLIAVAVGIAYLIGRAIGWAAGRARGRTDRPPTICLTLELEGEVLGGLHIAGVRFDPHEVAAARRAMAEDDDLPPGPPPGHPEA